MKLTDEQIRSIMEKNVCCKTILVENSDVSKLVFEYEKDGWKLIKKSEINGRTKLTFEKVSN